MHDQLLNHEVARLQRSEFLRESDRRHTVDREPRVRRTYGIGLLDRVSSFAHRHPRLTLHLRTG